MTLSRTVRQCLAIAVSLALLRPDFAVAAAVESARSTPITHAIAMPIGAVNTASLKLSAPVSVSLNAPAISALPTPATMNAAAAAAQPAAAAAVSAALARPDAGARALEAYQSLGLPEAVANRSDASKVMAAADSIKDEKLRTKMQAMALAATASQANGSSGSEIGAQFDGSSANDSKAADNLWTRMSRWSWMPNGLAKRFAAKGAAKAPKSQPQDPATLEVSVAKARWTPAVEMLPESTREVALGDKQIVGQDRALKSIYWGLKIPGQNYNLFVSGPDGSGRETALRHIVSEIARTMPTPNDMVAVTNFEDPSNPLILEMPAGSGVKLSAAVDKFVKAYSTMLPQVLGSKQVSDMRKAVKAQFESTVAERDAAFDAEVAQVRLSNAKFGLYIMRNETETGYSVGAVPTYKDPQSGEYKTITSVDEKEHLIADGVFTAAEWDAAVKEAKTASKPWLEKLEAMLHENAAMAEKANEQIGQINGQVAMGVVQQLGPSVIAAVSKNRHDTPEHKEFEKRMKARHDAFQAEVAKVRLGQYGIMVEVMDGQLAVGLTKNEGGRMVPMTPEEAQAVLESGAVTQAAIQKAVKPIVAKLKEMSEIDNREHEAVHAKDAPMSAEEKQAVSYVKRLLGVAAQNYGVFIPSDEELPPGKRKVDPEEMFRVSVLADHSMTAGAPVVWVNSPTYERMFGAVDDNGKVMLVPGVGAVKTASPGGPSFKGGAMQQANGGFLILNVMDALREPGVWPALIKALRNGQAEIAEGGLMGIMTQKGETYHTNVKTKVVLLGSPMLKMLIAHHDEDFARLFNASAEFEPTLNIGKDAIDGYLQFMKKVIVQSGGQIMDLSRDAISAVLEFSARIAGSNTKLTAQFGAMYSLMREASFWAKEAGRKEVRREDIDQALNARSESEDVYVRHMMDLYKSGVFKVDTAGAKVGQINGMAVMGSMGVPMRITVVHSASNGGFNLLSADNDAGTTGSSWKKSWADTRGYLMKLFGQKRPLAGNVSVSFEQNYGGIDGDSATTTMIYAILSSLSGVPIQQRFAVTGSADQFGNVQAIGGANEKTEGFFTVASQAVAKAYADGMNAVIIPADNENDLMLRPDVVQAVREGRFKIYKVKTVKEGMELLTGVAFDEILQKAQARLDELRMAK